MYIVHFGEAGKMNKEERRLLLGGKGASLAEMSTDLGLSVPPGFVITTEAFHRFYNEGSLSFLQKEITAAMSVIEQNTRRSFGDSNDPLLVSVRSGAPVSMPGMMDTILNLGLNNQTTSALAAKSNPAFASECRSRFESMFEEIVIQKGNSGISHAPSDVWQQLHLAIEAVFYSWNSPRAQTFREVENISDDFGTAVTIQAMVFGNTSEHSGTGVLFTRNPSTGADELFGDFLPNAQGEDVVSGSHQTLGINEMENIAPEAFKELVKVAHSIENATTDMCDIEFTVEEKKLWILQSRIGKRTPIAAVRIAKEMTDDIDFPLTRIQALHRLTPDQLQAALDMDHVSESSPPIAKGLGASPGVATGQLVFTADTAVEESDKGVRVLLIRPETSPADVHGMAVAQGIITATGGLASHAAVVARGWGIPAVVGVTTLSLLEDSATFGDVTLSEGDVVTLDGTSGEIFIGDTQIGESETTPAVETFLTWIEETITENGIEIPSGTSSRDRLQAIQSMTF